MAKTKRERQITYIMQNAYNNDRARDYDRNLAYLESLSNAELNELYEHTKWEIDHQD